MLKAIRNLSSEVQKNMLESFQSRPEVLTDDDVIDILKQSFSQTDMKEAIAESVKRRGTGELLTE